MLSKNHMQYFWNLIVGYRLTFALVLIPLYYLLPNAGMFLLLVFTVIALITLLIYKFLLKESMSDFSRFFLNPLSSRILIYSCFFVILLQYGVGSVIAVAFLLALDFAMLGIYSIKHDVADNKLILKLLQTKLLLESLAILCLFLFTIELSTQYQYILNIGYACLWLALACSFVLLIYTVNVAMKQINTK